MSLEEKYDEIERQMREEAREFDPKCFRADAIHEVYIESLNLRIRFGVLSAEELLEVYKQPPEEQNFHIVYRMLRKAYPGLTVEDMKKMDGVVFTIIMSELFRKTNFFKLQGVLSR